MQKIILAIDSFKGCLTSFEVAEACKSGILRVFPTCNVVIIPISDGGEGTLETLISATGGTIVSTIVHNPVMEKITASYGILGNRTSAVIEMAKASGLTLIPNHRRNPLLTTTYGTGELIKDAIMKGCREILVGIGGSATNDAGIGMLQALGYRFYDKDHNLLGTGGQILEQVAFIDDSSKLPELDQTKFIIACDVNNPFAGENGAAYVYAPQKGATPEMVQQLDKGLKNIANLIFEKYQIDVQNIPGAGAAGGLGGAFVAFLNATLQSGIQVVLDKFEFECQIKNADLIITGEGKMDAQTLMGKAPQGILKAAQKEKIPVIAITGGFEQAYTLNSGGIDAVFSITPYPVSLDKAMDKEFATSNIEQTTVQIMNIFHIKNKVKL
ncbi:MAG: glycerate kinase [Bacteroidales bacterium]|nr:glycerate kinase [Bacteroidales bacterium]